MEVEGGFVLRVSAERLEGVGPALKVGVRPEKVHIEAVPEGADEALPGWNHVTGLLRVASFLGVSHQFTVDGPGGSTLTVYAQNAGAESLPRAGDRVRLAWRPEQTFVVPASDRSTDPSDRHDRSTPAEEEEG